MVELYEQLDELTDRLERELETCRTSGCALARNEREYRTALREAGLVLAGTSPDGLLVEAVEVPGKRFYVGVQYHPEFKSRPNRAHPLFREFVAASLRHKKN